MRCTTCGPITGVASDLLSDPSIPLSFGPFAMPTSHSARSLRLVVRPIFGCMLVAATALPASAQSVGRTEAVDAKKPFAQWSESVHNLRDSLVAVARAQIGTRYVMGGTSPDRGFDCSGLVRYVMAAFEVKLPRTAAQQARIGHEVSRDRSHLRPGDLLTFGRKGKAGVSHIGIYVGEGHYIHASSAAGRVIESDLSRTASPLIKGWRGVRRVVAGTDSDSTRKGDG
jgi:cell wall-associated NlpC family hydrolase